jgi:hypothetical protein
MATSKKMKKNALEYNLKKIEDDLKKNECNGRQPQKMQGRQPQKEKKEDDLKKNGRRPPKKNFKNKRRPLVQKLT